MSDWSRMLDDAWNDLLKRSTVWERASASERAEIERRPGELLAKFKDLVGDIRSSSSSFPKARMSLSLEQQEALEDAEDRCLVMMVHQENLEVAYLRHAVAALARDFEMSPFGERLASLLADVEAARGGGLIRKEKN